MAAAVLALKVLDGEIIKALDGEIFKASVQSFITKTFWSLDSISLTLDVLFHTIPHKLCRCQVKDVNGLQSFVTKNSEGGDSLLFILCNNKSF